MNDVPPLEAMHVLRSHDQAGALLRQLEAWLHQPNPDRSMDVNELLQPYRNVADESIANERMTNEREV